MEVCFTKMSLQVHGCCDTQVKDTSSATLVAANLAIGGAAGGDINKFSLAQ